MRENFNRIIAHLYGELTPTDEEHLLAEAAHNLSLERQLTEMRKLLTAYRLTPLVEPPPTDEVMQFIPLAAPPRPAAIPQPLTAKDLPSAAVVASSPIMEPKPETSTPSAKELIADDLPEVKTVEVKTVAPVLLSRVMITRLAAAIILGVSVYFIYFTSPEIPAVTALPPPITIGDFGADKTEIIETIEPAEVLVETAEITIPPLAIADTEILPQVNATEKILPPREMVTTPLVHENAAPIISALPMVHENQSSLRVAIPSIAPIDVVSENIATENVAKENVATEMAHNQIEIAPPDITDNHATEIANVELTSSTPSPTENIPSVADDLPAFLRTAQTLYAEDKIMSALFALDDEHLAAAAPEIKATALTLKARAELKLKRWQDMEKTITQLREISPLDATVLARLRTLALQQNAPPTTNLEMTTETALSPREISPNNFIVEPYRSKSSPPSPLRRDVGKKFTTDPYEYRK